MMHQQAPFPRKLADLVSKLAYKPEWKFTLKDLNRGQGSSGLTLVISINPPNAYHLEKRRPVSHYMLVPPAAYDERSWRRWLFEQILLVERHEAMEFFRFETTEGGPFMQRDGTLVDTYTERPFAPHHGPGNDPYLIFEHGTDTDVKTSFLGTINE